MYSTTSTERWVEKKLALDKTPDGQADIYVIPIAYYKMLLVLEELLTNSAGMLYSVCLPQNVIK